MADVRDLFYHGIRQNIRRVLVALGPERVDKGLTAFEDGDSNWSECFFARALKPEHDLTRGEPERIICEALGLMTTDGRPNRVPVRLVYYTFDGVSTLITRDEMRKFIEDVRDESRPTEVMNLLRQLNYEGVEERPIALSC